MKIIPEDLSQRSARWDIGLHEVVDCLQAYRERYFLDCGTLLGAIREKDYIPWDNDIDIGLIREGDSEARCAKLAEALHCRGFVVHLAKSGITCLRSPDIEINITFYRDSGNGYEAVLYTADPRYPLCTFLLAVKRQNYIATFGHGRKQRIKRLVLAHPWIAYLMPDALGGRLGKLQGHPVRIPHGYIENLAYRSFRGMSVATPADAEGYLALRYGAGWRTPLQDYRFDRDDGALGK